MGGFFIGHPQFTKYSDDITTEVRELTIQTNLRVRVPLPFLVVANQLDKNNLITLTSVYKYRITNPKKLGAETAN